VPSRDAVPGSVPERKPALVADQELRLVI
jgi:hypothetical protein